MSSTQTSTQSTESEPTVVCRACGLDRGLSEFRIFSTGARVKRFDFCTSCEHLNSTIVLYRRYTAYATPEIVEAVFRAERTPEAKRSADQQRYLITKKERPADQKSLIEEELERRELSRRRLVFYIKRFMPEYKVGWVHHDVARRLEKFMRDIEQGLSPRLMIFMPPRTGKSKEISDFGVSWMMGHHPEWEFINASYAQSLPLEFSRSIRDRISDVEHQRVFPKCLLRRDSQAIDRWNTTGGGGYMAAGIGVGITGRGYNVGIIDDPIKDQEAAQSEVIRANTLAWYQTVFRTRAAPGAGILVVQTRWHDADLAGALLEAEDQLRKQGVPEEELEGWEVVSYPALAEEDEYLLEDGKIFQGKPGPEQRVKRLLRRKDEAIHPERYSANDFKKLRNTLAPAQWSALYQQNPAPDDGDFFQRKDFRYHQLARDAWAQGIIITTCDYAFKEKARNDWTVIATGVYMPDGKLYVLQIKRGRWKSLSVANELLSTFREFKPQIFGGEQGATHAAIWPFVEQELLKPENRDIPVTVDEELVPVQDKSLRARPLQAMFQLHNVVFCMDPMDKTTIWDVAERELLRFPTGAHDDIVDALAWMARIVTKTPAPVPPSPEQQKSWKDELQQYVTDHTAETSFMAG